MNDAMLTQVTCSYRRDVGDALINAYYVLRDDMLGYFVGDILEQFASRREGDGWEVCSSCYPLHPWLLINEKGNRGKLALRSINTGSRTC
jgi:hypothetical protein